MIKVIGNGWAELVFDYKKNFWSPVTKWCTIGRVIEIGYNCAIVEFYSFDQVLETRVFEVNTNGL